MLLINNPGTPLMIDNVFFLSFFVHYFQNHPFCKDFLMHLGRGIKFFLLYKNNVLYLKIDFHQPRKEEGED